MDFLSHAALVGFMAGAAIVIGLQQLKGLFGLSHFTNKTDVVSVLSSVFHSLHHPVRTCFFFSFAFSSQFYWSKFKVRNIEFISIVNYFCSGNL